MTRFSALQSKGGRRLLGSFFAALLLACCVPVRAAGEGDQVRSMDRMREERLDELRARRAEREMVRDRQREGLAPAGDGHTLRDMNQDERRRFRRELNDAAREMYRNPR